MPHITLDPDTCVSNIEFEIGEYSPMFLTDLPDYTGETTVTPSMETQTLETANKAMHDNVVVEAIPYEEVEAATPAITVDASGKVTATTNQQGGIVEQATKQAEYQQTVVERARPSVTVDNSGKIIATTSQVGGFVQAGTESTELQQETVIQATPTISVASDGTITATATQTAGYVAAGTKTATQAQETVEQATPSITVDNTGKITASATQTAGFVNAGTKSATYSLPTQGATTITPTESTQTAVTAGKWTTGQVKVNAIPGEYVKPSGSLSITENGTYDVSGYANVEVKVRATVAMLNYYSWDGETLLFSEEITNGGDGTYQGTPTRESTEQYQYAFAGWATSIDQQAAEEGATRNVVRDRDVYAAYTRTVRTYTVTWKNADGSTLETDQNVPYGSTPHYDGETPTYEGETSIGWQPAITTVTGNATYTATYTPVYNVRFYNGTTLLETQRVKQGGTAVYSGSTPVDPDGEGKEFIGWDKALTNVQADMDVYAQYKASVQVVEIEDTWDTIIANVNNGTAADKYPLGAYKPLDLGTEGTVNMQIVGKGVDPLADGTGNATLSFISMELLKTVKRRGDMATEAFDTYLDTTIAALIPSNVGNAIKAVTKQTLNTSDAVQTSASRKLWVPSYGEVNLNGYNGVQYEQNGPVYSEVFATNAKRKKTPVDGTSATRWFARTATGSGYKLAVSNGGVPDSNFYTNTFTAGIALGFCI